MQVIHIVLPDAGTEEALDMARDIESARGFTDYTSTDNILAQIRDALRGPL